MIYDFFAKFKRNFSKTVSIILLQPSMLYASVPVWENPFPGCNTIILFLPSTVLFQFHVHCLMWDIADRCTSCLQLLMSHQCCEFRETQVYLVVSCDTITDPNPGSEPNLIGPWVSRPTVTAEPRISCFYDYG